MYLDKWTEENTGLKSYKILHFKPTEYEIEYFNSIKDGNSNIGIKGTNKSRKQNTLVEDIQKHLRRLGYYQGKIDGISGKGTTSSIKAYQRDNNLKIDGNPSSTLKNHIESNTIHIKDNNFSEGKEDKRETLEQKIEKSIDGVFKILFKNG